MEILRATGADIPELLEMAMDLWPDYEKDELQQTLQSLLDKPRHIIFTASADKGMSGFIYMGIRIDYVEGSDSSPTGYIEGIYVRPAYRKTGVARQLLLTGESWLRENGCKQIGSDTHINNKQSFLFHTHMGFKEESRLIAFIKDL